LNRLKFSRYTGVRAPKMPTSPVKTPLGGKTDVLGRVARAWRLANALGSPLGDRSTPTVQD
jgi:hypothetical protein